MKKYCRIVFIQGYDSDAEEVFHILNNQGTEKAIEYLRQWDYGTESENILSLFDESAKGKNDQWEQVGEYLLSWNSRLGYVGLERITENYQEK